VSGAFNGCAATGSSWSRRGDWVVGRVAEAVLHPPPASLLLLLRTAVSTRTWLVPHTHGAHAHRLEVQQVRVSMLTLARSWRASSERNGERVCTCTCGCAHHLQYQCAHRLQNQSPTPCITEHPHDLISWRVSVWASHRRKDSGSGGG
jgi:hypothetical protein